MHPESFNGYEFEDLRVGMTGEFGKTITEADIIGFAGISGDFNPVHVNEDYARKTAFKGRIAHGMLSAAFISAVLGTRLPGPGCIYVAQSLRFKAPVHVGDTVIARVELTELIPEKHRAVFKTTCHVGDTLIVDGEATLMVPARD